MSKGNFLMAHAIMKKGNHKCCGFSDICKFDLFKLSTETVACSFVGWFKCDIAVGGARVRFGSGLVQYLRGMDPRVDKVMTLVRRWAKLRHLNNAERGTLCSFLLNLMVRNTSLTFAQPRFEVELACNSI